MKEDQVVQEESGFQDDEESLFQDIDLLQKHGINMADIKKLKSVGICTIKGIQMTTRRALCNVKGLSEAKVEKIKEAANKLIEPGFLTAFQYSERRKMVFHITTGSQEFEISYWKNSAVSYPLCDSSTSRNRRLLRWKDYLHRYRKYFVTLLFKQVLRQYYKTVLLQKSALIDGLCSDPRNQ